MQKKKTCPDCGNAPVYHTVEKNLELIELLLSPFIAIPKRIWKTVEPVIGPSIANQFSPRLYKTLARLGIGSIARDPDEKTSSRARILWEEAKRRGIDMWEYRLGGGREAFVASFAGTTIGFGSLPRPGRTEPASLEWVDNKKLLRKYFTQAGIPVAKGGSARSHYTAVQIFESVTPPVIAKPHRGSRSRHTTTHITNTIGLSDAFKKAKVLSRTVIIEEELAGFVHRATVINGKLVGILRREPPMVIADGAHTITELVEIENQNPKRDENIFHAIVIDKDAQAELARQSLTLFSIPPKGIIVTLHQKSSRGIGGGATDVTDIAHKENIRLFEYVAKVLDDSVVGIDFIISDIAKSWRDTPRSGVIECNSLPFIDIHHYPLVGTPRDVTGALWDMVMPASKGERNNSSSI